MKTEQVFIGNIRRCTAIRSNLPNDIDGAIEVLSGKVSFFEVEDELYKENAILIQTKKGNYVDLEVLNSVLNYIKFSMCSKSNYCSSKLTLATFPRCFNDLFVEAESLKHYYTGDGEREVSVYQLKKQVKGAGFPFSR